MLVVILVLVSVVLQVDATLPPECRLPAVTGLCRARMPRYFYNTQTRSCQDFTYGGCNGNANNFHTLDACQSRCMTDDVINNNTSNNNRNNNRNINNECRLPARAGWCRARIPRYFYDTQTRSCQDFTYGGCGGNDNNFHTLEDCQSRCVNTNSNNGIFIYNHNYVCQRPMSLGWCSMSLPRFYYNTARRECLNFTFGGCMSNGNNFLTLEDCVARCSNDDNNNHHGYYDNSDICMLPPDAGPCRGYSRLYYYDRHTGQCDTFVYGLCGGNDNKFYSRTLCQARCGGAGVIGGSYPSQVPVPRPNHGLNDFPGRRRNHRTRIPPNLGI